MFYKFGKLGLSTIAIKVSDLYQIINEKLKRCNDFNIGGNVHLSMRRSQTLLYFVVRPKLPHASSAYEQYFHNLSTLRKTRFWCY